ncbi:trimeric LpxA-like protein [Polychaeton citri CBS 116435]|uniref:Trimeric LpxA-like protein n=1 Tax=Polychaeton citri CBS 116435 TaxID=1314669 RepID=A0A9P4Q2L5_9PEZI|nr:trimeric LpxA-like protein [Polychaeton citri CBS 116435]
MAEQTSKLSANKARALRGELYYAFTPEMTAERLRCLQACEKFNNAGRTTRRKQVQMWRDIIDDKTPLPAEALTPAEDEDLFTEEVWVEPPIHIDYGTNVHLADNVFINFNCTILDTCKVTIGSRTLVASNVSFYSGTHPLDPEVRNGTKGPEMGGEIHIGEDVWIGGSVVILPGVTIGNGVVVGAGSVVTKVSCYHISDFSSANKPSFYSLSL